METDKMDKNNYIPGEEGRSSPDSSAHGEMRNGNELHRGLKPRHLQMIAIGGVIGTGLFLGTANNLKNGGPAGLLIGYCIMASLLFSVMVILGEMISQFPVPGGHTALAARYVSADMSFALGWLYWFFNTIVLPAEISAAVVLVSYWTGDSCGTSTSGICNNALWVGLMLIVVYAINFSSSRAYGEMEFWFASIKVITVVGLIILGIIISAGGVGKDPIGFKYWNETGGFVQYMGIPGAKGRFLGFFSVLISAAFAFIGTEVTAIAAAETADPRRAVPKAIKSVWIRLVVFYICSAFIIGLLVSPSDPSLDLASTAAKSPFVIAIKEAGIPVLPSIINAAILTSAWSAGCADLYISSRALHGLASRGQAPKIFAKTNENGLPFNAVCLGAAFGLLSFMAASQNSSAGTVFTYFSSLTSICGIISWICILCTGLRWQYGLKAQGIDRSTLAYVAPLQPYLSLYGLSVCFIVLIFGGFTAFMGGFDASTFVTTYLPIPVFLIMLLAYKFVKKSKVVKYEDMDFVTGCSADAPVDTTQKSKWRKFADNI